MQHITCSEGKIVTLSSLQGLHTQQPGFFTELEPLDELLPPQGLSRGAVHELISNPQQSPASAGQQAAGDALSVAMLLAQAATRGTNAGRAICYAGDNLYPPALQAWGIDLRHLLVLRPSQYNAQQTRQTRRSSASSGRSRGDPRQQALNQRLWALCECLKCPAVGVVISPLERLTQLHARRLQLAAEEAGAIGIWLRHANDRSAYAAATRWLIEPARQKNVAQRQTQQWKLTLLHGHGGRIGNSVLLEMNRAQQNIEAKQIVHQQAIHSGENVDKCADNTVGRQEKKGALAMPVAAALRHRSATASVA